MRDIKFRAWSNYSNKMVSWNDMKNDLETLVGVLNREDKKINVMQYCGFNDKNGINIYEGDVVRKTYNEVEVFLGQVVYREGVYLLELKEGEFIFLSDENSIYENEIIGNIHENSDILINYLKLNK